MSKKYLRKNEFRIDNNPKHYGEKKEPHPAYITARYGHSYRANLITHSRKTKDGFDTYIISENPNKKSHDGRATRVSPPFWQKDNLFSQNVLPNFKFSKRTRKQIRNYNKKYK